MSNPGRVHVFLAIMVDVCKYLIHNALHQPEFHRISKKKNYMPC